MKKNNVHKKPTERISHLFMYVMMGIIAVLSIVLPFIYLTLAIKWWVIAAWTLFIFALATPDYLVDKRWERSFIKVPLILLKSLFNLTILAGNKKRFINKNK